MEHHTAIDYARARSHVTLGSNNTISKNRKNRTLRELRCRITDLLDWISKRNKYKWHTYNTPHSNKSRMGFGWIKSTVAVCSFSLSCTARIQTVRATKHGTEYEKRIEKGADWLIVASFGILWFNYVCDCISELRLRCREALCKVRREKENVAQSVSLLVAVLAFWYEFFAQMGLEILYGYCLYWTYVFFCSHYNNSLSLVPEFLVSRLLSTLCVCCCRALLYALLLILLRLFRLIRSCGFGRFVVLWLLLLPFLSLNFWVYPLWMPISIVCVVRKTIDPSVKRSHISYFIFSFWRCGELRPLSC